MTGCRCKTPVFRHGSAGAAEPEKGNTVAKAKIYAVKKGLTRGIYGTWDECRAVTDGFPGAVYRSFSAGERAAAERWVSGEDAEPQPEEKSAASGSPETPAGTAGVPGKKVYAVRNGRETGVLDTWDRCLASVHGFPGAVYKSFPSAERKKAEEWAAEEYASAGQEDVCFGTEDGCPGMPGGMPFAFTDGSFSEENGRYAYGGFLAENGYLHVIRGYGSDPSALPSRNIAGEIAGASAAMELAVKLGLRSLSIYYDYQGVALWADTSSSGWKNGKKSAFVEAYMKTAAETAGKLKLSFVHVKGHTGIDGNEAADALARSASGASLSAKHRRALDDLGMGLRPYRPAEEKTTAYMGLQN